MEKINIFRTDGMGLIDLRPHDERQAEGGDPLNALSSASQNSMDDYKVRFKDESDRLEKELAKMIEKAASSLVKQREKLKNTLENAMKQLDKYGQEAAEIEKQIDQVRAEAADSFKSKSGQPTKEVSEKLRPLLSKRGELGELVSVLSKDVIPETQAELIGISKQLEAEVMSVFNSYAEKQTKECSQALHKMLGEREGFNIARDALFQKFGVSNSVRKNCVDWKFPDDVLGMMCFR